MLNLLTDVEGLQVGHAHDDDLLSGVTAILFDPPAVASVTVPGGAPAGRDLGCLEPDAAVEAIDAIVLSGGSGFGLDAATGVQSWLRERGRGFPVGHMRVPIVPSAILFDLLNGGDKDWGRHSPYRDLGYRACESAAGGPFALGNCGAGLGASTADVKGGTGSASSRTSGGHTVAALAVVNALGSALFGRGPHFIAAPLEQGREFGGLGLPAAIDAEAMRPSWKGNAGQPATTIACVATDARLGKSEAKRLAIAASAGLARGLRVSSALMDGDTVFAAATGRGAQVTGAGDLVEIGAVAADCLARAIARAVYCCQTPPGRWSGPPAWRDRFGEVWATGGR